MTKYKQDKLMKLLAIIGGIIALIEAILSFVGLGFTSFDFLKGGIISAIVALILAIIVILSVVKPEKIPFNAIFLLILGILIIIFGSLLGGILVLIAGILGFVK